MYSFAFRKDPIWKAADFKHDTSNAVWQPVPVPIRLEPIFRLSCPVEEVYVVGDSGQGIRKIVPIAQGGRIESSQVPAFDRVVSMPGGSDYLRTDRFGKTRPDARYFSQLETGTDMMAFGLGKMINDLYSISNRVGFAADQTAKNKLFNGELEPKQYYFRMKLVLECDDPDAQVQDVVNKVVIASAVRQPNSVVYQAYVVE